ncbi:MAG: toxin-antitoxin system HicB family antitoxin [Alphaproteobacteria bacterium]|nr:toxin-antitoxin system HicB family antitoxin [Alphaproteobacteria bacterium]
MLVGYGGKFVQRILKSLHQRLAKRATAKGVSLNQLAAMLLVEGLVCALPLMNPNTWSKNALNFL